MFDADLAIIGGGPSGASTALHLLALRPELKVAVFEKKRVPREKYCAGAVSAWGIAVLDGLGLGSLAVGLPIRAVAVRVGADVGRVERDGLGVVVRRSTFDASLLEAAGRRGAIVEDGAPVREIVREADGWRLAVKNGNFRARIVVGADGAAGFSRRALGFREPKRRAHLYLVETIGPELRDRVADGTMLFDLTPAAEGSAQGYYWDFAAPLDGTAGTSRGAFHLNERALARADSLKRVMDDALRLRGVDPTSVERKAHSIRPAALGERASVRGALLVGEAVGVDPVTGEGIAHGLAYGALAAAAIDDGLQRDDLSFRDWHLRIQQSFVGRHLRDACRLAPQVYGRHAGRFARFLARSPEAMAMGVRWYVGDPISRREKLSMFASFAAAWATGRLAAGRTP
jgi:flavin-dependent dehydrogenase